MSEIGDDKVARERILPLLYVQRRRTMKSPGLGETEISRLLITPLELAEFHLCYIKTKGWVERLETGHLAVPALGVDRQKDPQDLSRGRGIVSVSEQNTYQKNQVR